MNGTQTGLTTNGATVPGAKPAPISSTGMTRCIDDDLFERLARLAVTGPCVGGPPLVLYRTETSEYGEIYIASPEYRLWFRRTYAGASELSDCTRPTASRNDEGQGKPAKLKSVQF